MQWDWPEIVSLPWIVEQENGDDLKLAPEWERPSRGIDNRLPRDVELVIGDHQSAAGNTYLAVKWWGYDCPTWELEEDVMARDCWENRQNWDKLICSAVEAEYGHSASFT
ncbi:hypothetical protein MY4038_010057 [Beauveria bassiana]